MNEDEYQDKNSGFDRGLDYTETKNLLIEKYKETNLKSISPDITDKRRNIFIRQLIYLLIAMTQLRNGCRVSEAVRAFTKYLNDNKISNKTIVKISKSDAMKKNKDGDMIKPKARFRNIVFQDWVEVDSNRILNTLKDIPLTRLKQRTLDYLLKKFNFNTHSLRYARVNYLLNEKKEDLTTVAKYIGHNNVNTLIIYCQKKNVDKMDNVDE